MVSLAAIVVREGIRRLRLARAGTFRSSTNAAAGAAR
jgi:hypothetical protein